MTFECYQRRLEGFAKALRAPETNAAADAWDAIQKALRHVQTFGAAIVGSLLDTGLVRKSEKERRRSTRAYTAGTRIYELLRDAKTDDDLQNGDADRLEAYTYDQLFSQ